MSTPTKEALAQVIANSYFAIEAGQEWDAEGSSYSKPEVNGGHMQLAHDIQRYLLAESQPPATELPLARFGREMSEAINRLTPATDDDREALRQLIFEQERDAVAGLRWTVDKFIDRALALRRLPVTEPCEWCDKPHTGFAEWQGDDIAHPSCGEHGHNFQPASVTEPTGAEIERATDRILSVWMQMAAWRVEAEPVEFARRFALAALVAARETGTP